MTTSRITGEPVTRLLLDAPAKLGHRKLRMSTREHRKTSQKSGLRESITIAELLVWRLRPIGDDTFMMQAQSQHLPISKVVGGLRGDKQSANVVKIDLVQLSNAMAEL